MIPEIAFKIRQQTKRLIKQMDKILLIVESV